MMQHRVERQGHIAPYCLAPTPRDLIPQHALNFNGVVLRENCHPPLFYLPLPVDYTCVWVAWAKIVDYFSDASWTMFHAEHWWKTTVGYSLEPSFQALRVRNSWVCVSPPSQGDARQWHVKIMCVTAGGKVFQHYFFCGSVKVSCILGLHLLQKLHAVVDIPFACLRTDFGTEGLHGDLYLLSSIDEVLDYVSLLISKIVTGRWN